jgi:hypothetical protein
MRNIWYPKKMAEYATSTRLQELGEKDTVLERDSTFLTNQERKAARAVQTPTPVPAATQGLSVEEATAISIELPLLSVRPA